MRGVVSFLLALLAALSPLFVVGPLNLYLTNHAEFRVGLLNMAFHLAPAAGVFVAVVLGAAWCVPERVLEWVTFLLLFLAAALYAQGNLLVWDYGVFDGRGIAWEDYPYRGWIDASAWLAIAVWFSRRRAWVLRWRRSLAAILILLPAMSSAAAFRSVSGPAPRWWTPRHWAADDSVYALSPDRNVVHIVLDGFQAPMFAELIRDEPALIPRFDGFTFFRNTVADFTATLPSIASMLTGVVYDNSTEFPAFLEKELRGSVPVMLAQNGYRVDVATLGRFCPYLPDVSCRDVSRLSVSDPLQVEVMELTRLLDVALFRAVPQPGKRLVQSRTEGWFQRLVRTSPGAPEVAQSIDALRGVIDHFNAGSDRPAYKFLHFNLPHGPYDFGSDCVFSEVVVTRENHRTLDRSRPQARCAIGLAAEVIDRMKAVGVFDASTIVISADHGSWRRTLPVAMPKGWPNIERALPLLLIKPARAPALPLRTSFAPVLLGDLAVTTARAAGVPGDFPGTDILAPPATMSRTRYFCHYATSSSDDPRYLPPMTRYRIDGDAWERAAWSVEPGIVAPGGSG